MRVAGDDFGGVECWFGEVVTFDTGIADVDDPVFLDSGFLVDAGFGSIFFQRHVGDFDDQSTVFSAGVTGSEFFVCTMNDCDVGLGFAAPGGDGELAAKLEVVW